MYMSRLSEPARRGRAAGRRRAAARGLHDIYGMTIHALI